MFNTCPSRRPRAYTYCRVVVAHVLHAPGQSEEREFGGPGPSFCRHFRITYIKKRLDAFLTLTVFLEA